MSDIKGIEPAFPRVYSHGGHNGMTLRDYFAAKAMQAEMPALRSRYDLGEVDVEDWTEAQSILAQYAYDMADAMLAARNAKDAQ